MQADAAFSDDGNDGRRRFGGRRLGLVGNQLAQERNEQNERDTDDKAARAERADPPSASPAAPAR